MKSYCTNTILLLLILVVPLALSHSVRGRQLQDATPTPTDSELLWNAAKSKWESIGLSDYHFGILKECRCTFNDPITIQVSNGEIIQMKDRNYFGDQVDQNTTGYSLTIEDIFGLIKTGMEQYYSAVDVEYDEGYGYPKKVFLDVSAMRAGDEYVLTIDYLAPLMLWQNELEAGKLLWSELELKTYNYTYRRFCHLIELCSTSKLVQVVDGNVVAIDGSPVTATEKSSSISLDEAPTMEDLFIIIQDAIDASSFRIGIEYDPAYGYPSSVYIDYDEMWADEEVIVSAKLEDVNVRDGAIEGVLSDVEMSWNASKSKWESMALSNYHFGIFKDCRCDFSDPIAIQVSNGEVIEMKDRSYFGDQVDQNTTGYSLTIEDIFGLIKTGIEKNHSSVVVEYDEDYGYPKKVILDASATDNEYTLTIDYLAPLTQWQNDLETGKHLWSERNVKTYNYSYRQFCHFIEWCSMAKWIQVVDGNVVAIDAGPGQDTSQSLDGAPTLDGLFIIIQDAINGNAFRVVVKYDPEYGYPTSVDIDYDEMWTDEEFVVSAKLEEVAV
ncbi:MAG: hypothetical protein SGBAC_006618 [Bacillariaceae sp.]